MPIERIGEYDVQTPEPPPLKTIPGYKKPAKEQKWKRTELFYDKKRDMDWEELRAEEELKRCPYLDVRGNPDYNGRYDNPDFVDYDWVNPDLENFRVQEWHRRLNGYWFMNNGVPTYMTGEHYFYCNWWILDNGYPQYKSADRKSYVLWWAAINDPDCFGLVEIMRRRQGKSWRASERAYEYPSRVPNAHTGVQSKERNAAKDFFTEKVVNPWKNLPDFFQPLSNSGTDPVSALEFKADKKKGKGSRGHKVTELNSWINWGPSTETHYDGQKLHRYICDEPGKTIEANVIKRHYIVKKACTDITNPKTDIIGKMNYITTVEDMETGGGSNFKALWDESAPIQGKKRNISGLWRYFQPAYEGYLIDDWGNDRIEDSKKKILNELELLKGDPRKYNAEKRFNPFIIEDCWGKDGTKCHFNPEKLQNRLEYLDTLESMSKPLYERYDLKWEDNKRDSKVKAIRNPNGRFYITFHPEDHERNNVARDETGHPVKPNNKTKYVIGDDPFDHEFIAEASGTTMSNAASYGFRKYDDTIDGAERDISKWRTNRFVVEYIARPTPNEFYEDMIKLCVYLGCQIHFERQKIGLRTYFINRGYKAFLMTRPDSTYSNTKHKDKMEGTPNSPTMLNAIVDTIDSYISEDIYGDDNTDDGQEHGHMAICDFPRMVRSWFDFDITNTKKYDATIGSGYALIGATKFIPRKATKLNDAKYFVQYTNYGSQSVAIEEPKYSDSDETPENYTDPYEVSPERMEEIMRDPYLRKEFGVGR